MIYIGSDHGGYELKNLIVEHLREGSFQFVDCGVSSGEACDYPDIAKDVCGRIGGGCKRNSDCTPDGERTEVGDMGILVCGTGIGMAMAANKISGIRAASVSDTYSARMTRAHNDANVLCLGGRVLGSGLALDIVDIFLATGFDGGRHGLRVAKFSD